MDGIKPPEPLAVEGNNLLQSWIEWKKDYEVYSKAVGLSNKPMSRQTFTMLHVMGKDARKIYDSFTWQNDPARANEDKEAVIAKFNNYFADKKRLRLTRKEFNSRVQKQGESVAQFITWLKNKVKECEFYLGQDENEKQALNDSLLVDRIIEGVQSNHLREKLLEEDYRTNNLTLEKAVEICIATELTESHVTSEEQPSSVQSQAAVQLVDSRYVKSSHSRGQQHRGRSRGRGSQSQRGRYQAYTPNTSSAALCTNCGRDHPPKECPASGQVCYNCQRVNHFASVCRSRSRFQRYRGRSSFSQYRGRGRGHYGQYGPQSQQHQTPSEQHRPPSDQYRQSSQRYVHTLENYPSYQKSPQPCQHGQEETPLEDRMEDLYVHLLSDGQKNNTWSVQLDINTVPVQFQIDTGSQANIINTSTYISVANEENQIQNSTIRLLPFGGSPAIMSSGEVWLSCIYKNKHMKLLFQVVDSEVPNIIGQRDSQALGLVQRIYNLPTQTRELSSAESVIHQHKDVFTGIGSLKNMKYSIDIDHTVPPVVHPPRQLPVSKRAQVKQELNRLENLQIIEKVTEPTDWVNSLVVVYKGDKVRICIDPKDLNKAIKRQHFPILTIEEVLTRVHGSKIFTCLDANKGFYQIVLDEKSSALTTFNTPFGRFRYKKMPMGLASSPEIFQRSMTELFGDLDGVEVIMDDILVHAPDIVTHNNRLQAVLQRAKEYNLKLNRDKLRLAQSEVEYIGHVLTANGVRASDDKVKAILEMQDPQSKEDLMRFLGMVTYVRKFIPNLSAISAPLRELLKKNVPWHWDPHHEASLKALKKALSTAPVLRYYSTTDPIVISCDSSSQGLGAVLLQNGQPIAYASKALTHAEKNYAQIEKETLAIVFACNKFHKLIFGRTVTVETDHKPIEAIYRKPLHMAPMRLQRMLLQLQPYSLNIIYKRGKDIPVADALSRAFVKDSKPALIDDTVTISAIDVIPFSTEKQQILKEQTAKDSDLQTLMTVINIGWPEERHKVPTCITPYFDIRDELACYDGILFKGDKVIIPHSMQKEMLALIHEGHFGMSLCKRRARDVIYWPRMNSEIEDLVSRCPICLSMRAKQPKEPLKPYNIPDRPWSRVGADLFEISGVHYLVMVDYYSDFFELDLLHSTLTSTIVQKMKAQMARHGIVDELITDNGPQFSSAEFRDFQRQYGFNHLTSSPTHAQSNGLAEKTVQIAKRLIIKSHQDGSDMYMALLNHRNTQRDTIIGSPVQRLFGRRTKTKLPTAQSLLKPKILEPQTVKAQLEYYRHENKKYFDKGSKELPKLQPGDTVRIQTDKGWSSPGSVINRCPEPRSYNVLTPAGRVIRRNRRHLLHTPNGQEVCHDPPPARLALRQHPPVPHQVLQHLPNQVQQNVNYHPAQHKIQERRQPQGQQQGLTQDKQSQKPSHQPQNSAGSSGKHSLDTVKEKGPTPVQPSIGVSRSGRTIKKPLRYC